MAEMISRALSLTDDETQCTSGSAFNLCYDLQGASVSYVSW